MKREKKKETFIFKTIHNYDDDLLLFYVDDSIALDKMLFSIQKYWYFSFFSTKTYVLGTH